MQNSSYIFWENEIIMFFEKNISGSMLFKAKKFIEDKDKSIEKEKDDQKLKKLITSKENKLQELNQLRKEAPHGEIHDWIEAKMVKRRLVVGKRSLKSTHVLKFSHSSSVGAGIDIEKDISCKISKKGVLTTENLPDIIHDIAHSNGNLITISRFLSLTQKRKMIYDFILEDDFSFLEPFSLSEDELTRWKESISNLIEEKQINTGLLTKQCYFPLNKNKYQNYHLLIPLFSSSMCQKIYSEVRETRFNEPNNIAIGKDPLYRDGVFIDFPSLAIQHFGGDYPRNISMLNANRSGQNYLFNTQPPVWQTQLTPPVHYGSMFDVPELSYACTDDIASLQKMLINSLDVYKRPEVMKGLENWCKSVANEVLTYVSQIQHIESGWSKGSRLSKQAISHCYLLDLYRDDEAFLSGRKNSDWQKTVSGHFARWLNQKLAGKDKQFTPQAEHRKIWQRIFADKLRDYMDIVLIEEGKQ